MICQLPTIPAIALPGLFLLGQVSNLKPCSPQKLWPAPVQVTYESIRRDEVEQARNGEELDASGDADTITDMLAGVRPPPLESPTIFAGRQSRRTVVLQPPQRLLLLFANPLLYMDLCATHML